ncbi:hypothetical protein HXX76_001470 [Chlamydomonas incerta]|uniref:Photolyase/cryptochrome alpha/beta domain-containing protein n=1 Tax=Chlamydomonas incerta TaxID=51695 RepID=A0A836B1B0_CHLIN|nr:hypothetical protein HXX76_001470 [Chlamydomonas incerta]|eukprot:KAG2444726.1 hypothetical protein HXX76_001470 [Chlamydomonas incerta]
MRLEDNEALTAAARHADATLAIHILDPRDLLPRRARSAGGLGVPKLGPPRARFMLEGLAELRRQLQELGQVSVAQEAAAAASARPGAAAVGPAAARAQASSSGGGDLVVRCGRTEQVLKQLLNQVLEAHPELRHVSLHYHMEPLPEPEPEPGAAPGPSGAAAEDREAAVQRMLAAWAAQRGVGCSVHPHWDKTLYHPDDLPYSMYGTGKAAGGQGSQKSGGKEGQQQAKQPQHQPQQQDGRQQYSQAANRDAQRYRTLPSVMTDFRRTTQSACVVRACLPPPAALPPPPGPWRQDAATAATAGAVAAGASVPAVESLWGEIPGSVTALYEAGGPEAVAALARLQELVGLDYSQLYPSKAATAIAGMDAAATATGAPAAAVEDPRSAFPFRAGSGEALHRLRYYVWGSPDYDPEAGTLQAMQEGQQQQQPLASPPSLLYFTNTRAQAVGVDSSTKLSPFCALGCITPRRIYQEVEAVREAAKAAALSSAAGEASAAAGGGGGACLPTPAECDWLAMHLCIRDFWTYTVLKEGMATLDERGIVGQPVSWRRDPDVLARWCSGRTGLPFVDANMRELAATGWMSNRGRQNVASLLAKDLQQDWRWGAELFECLLLDSDVAVNYCNWNYFAGVGNDPRNRRFKTVTQGMQYDEDAVLAATWLPELARLPPRLRHTPWANDLLPAEQEAAAAAAAAASTTRSAPPTAASALAVAAGQVAAGQMGAAAAAFGVVLGRDYPLPIVDPVEQTGTLPAEEKARKAAKARGKVKL